MTEDGFYKTVANFKATLNPTPPHLPSLASSSPFTQQIVWGPKVIVGRSRIKALVTGGTTCVWAAVTGLHLLPSCGGREGYIGEGFFSQAELKPGPGAAA